LASTDAWTYELVALARVVTDCSRQEEKFCLEYRKEKGIPANWTWVDCLAAYDLMSEVDPRRTLRDAYRKGNLEITKL
jgi:hypothetical protein